MSRRTAPWSAISTRIREACEQLQATPSGPSAFRILWVVALHSDDEFVIDCIEKRLFGVEDLTAVRSVQAGVRIVPCYYYSHSEFARVPILDAAILSKRRASLLCVNSFSPRRDSLRRTRLCSLAGGHRAVVDPEMLEQTGEAFLIDRPIDRANGGQWQFLRDKYGYGTARMLEGRFEALLSVPRDVLGDRD